MVSTIAGLLGNSGSTDDTGSAARFTNPVGMVINGGILYLTEANHTVRSVNTSTFVVTTIAGSAGNSGVTS